MSLKKPKLLKLPKRPNRSASISVLERFLARVAEVRQENARRQSAYKTALKKLADLRRRVFAAKTVSAVAPVRRRKTKTAARRKRVTKRKKR